MIKWLMVMSLSALVSLVGGYIKISHELESSAVSATAKVDEQIKNIINVIDSLPSDPYCGDEVKREYANISHEDERIRAVGYIYDTGEQWHVCSMLGRQLSKLNYWRGTKKDGVFIGHSLLTVHFPETSFVVSKDKGKEKAFAYVNPRRVLGYWIEPSLAYANYSLTLDSDCVPFYTRAPVKMESMLLQTAHSEKHPYSIQATASVFDVLQRAGIYWLRVMTIVLLCWGSYRLLSDSLRQKT
ncbi:hypothetical protein JCM19240_1980 [Vibrio maritimus]|uniref:Uncharacterized protein n=1 Tax=Vibrio maritimus TaxID=990268 RepID=A0A090T3F2_9VIBR|nr:hypothetical protein JCM19240_1980 [Vibrio maritimus]